MTRTPNGSESSSSINIVSLYYCFKYIHFSMFIVQEQLVRIESKLDKILK